MTCHYYLSFVLRFSIGFSIQHLLCKSCINRMTGCIKPQHYRKTTQNTLQIFVGRIYLSGRRVQYVFNVTICVFQDNLKTSRKTSWKTKNCYSEDVCKLPSRHVLKTYWRCLQSVLETNKIFTGVICI